MSYHTLKTADGGKFDIQDIDGSIIEEFDNMEDIRSYFSGKYGLKVSDAIVAVLDKCGQCLLPHQACHCQNR